MLIFLQNIGWLGAGLLLLAYYLNSTGKVNAEDSHYQGLNIVGVILVGTSAFVTGNWPSVGLQAVWGAIGAYALMRRKR